jgi:hypothetical protein
MNPGRFWERLFCWVFVNHTTIKPKHSYSSRTSFHSCCVSNENCKCPHRNYTPKRENCFAILISVCNFHISLQFSYQFAIITFWCIVPTWMFAIIIWVCNFHISLQFSYQFAILTSHKLKNLWPTTQVTAPICYELPGLVPMQCKLPWLLPLHKNTIVSRKILQALPCSAYCCRLYYGGSAMVVISHHSKI